MLSPQAMATFNLLRDMLREGGQRIPNHELAFRRGVNETTAKRHVTQLEMAGLIVVDRIPKRSSLYTLTDQSYGGELSDR